MAVLFKGRWLYINLITLGLVFLVFWWWQQTTQEVAESEANWIPDYYLTHATISQYDDQGVLSSSISAERFTHIREFGTTDMIRPRFNLYLQDSSAWFGKAEEGLILDSGAQINLSGNVLVTNGPDILRPLSLKSQSLRLFPNQNYAESDDRVQLIGKHSHLTGKGMQLTLDSQRLLLLNQVTGTHLAPRN
ncbi:MAG: LPS export ABC transporter periplasmic protein LptC [Gammaproteobacteria bacterium]|nr:LPS export ABC transporter periplasmic protein LptC [Gammaproteobacteria bacterium]